MSVVWWWVNTALFFGVPMMILGTALGFVWDAYRNSRTLGLVMSCLFLGWVIFLVSTLMVSIFKTPG